MLLSKSRSTTSVFSLSIRRTTFELFFIDMSARHTVDEVDETAELAVLFSLGDYFFYRAVANSFDCRHAYTDVAVFDRKFAYRAVDVGRIDLVAVVFKVSKIVGDFAHVGYSVVENSREEFDRVIAL